MMDALDALVERETVTCGHCRLVQYQTALQMCRRCRMSTAPPPALPPPPEPEPLSAWAQRIDMEGLALKTSLEAAIALTVLANRTNLNLSQKGLGAKMGVSRTYISKIENALVTPNVRTMDRFASGLNLTLGGFVQQFDTLRQMIDKTRGEASWAGLRTRSQKSG